MALSYTVLRNANFRRLLATRLCGIFGLQAQAVIVGWQVYTLTKDPFMLGLVGLVVAGYGLWLLSPVLAPFLFSAVLAYLGDPLADRLERLGLSRTLSVVTVFVSMFALILVLLLFIVPMLERQATQLFDQAPAAIDWYNVEVRGWLRQQFNLPLPQLRFDAIKKEVVTALQSAGSDSHALIATISQSSAVLVGWTGQAWPDLLVAGVIEAFVTPHFSAPVRWGTAAVTGGRIRVEGLGTHSTQGDLHFVDEAVDEVFVFGKLRQDLLNDDELLEAFDLAELGQKDLAHAAARQPLEQEKSPEGDGKLGPQKRRGLHLRLRRRHQGLHVTSAPAPCK